MEENFEKAMAFVFKWEGGYSMDPSDPGGETNWGISKKAHPDLDIKNLTKEQAKEIYHEDYWKATGCYIWPDKFDIVVFDTAVNVGPARALNFAKMTQDWKDYLFIRMNYYAGLNLAKYLKGWINRVIDLWSLLR
jgi:lysozyme family protein